MADIPDPIIHPDRSQTSWLAAFPPRRKHLLSAALLVTAVYLIAVTNRWWPLPDSALYLGIGRSLAEGKGYWFNGATSTTASPGLPFVLAGLRLLFGDCYWPGNLLSALCGLAAVWLVYLTVARLSDRRMALAVSVATAGSYTFFHYCNVILTDAPATAIFWLILYACVRARGQGSVWWSVLAAVLTPALIAVRIPSLLPMGCLVVGLMLGKTSKARVGRKVLLGATLAVLLAVTGGLLYIIARSGGHEVPAYAEKFLKYVNARNLGSLIPRYHLGLAQIPNTLSEMLTSQEHVWPLSIPAVVTVVFGTVSLWRHGQRFLVPLVMLYPLVLAFMGYPVVRPRYLMPVHPLLVFVILHGLCDCVDRWRRRQRLVVVLVGLYPLLLALVAHDIWRKCNLPFAPAALAILIAAGLCLGWLVVRFRKRQPARPVPFLRVVIVAVVIIVGSNLPKILRTAVYYRYLSHTDRYYDVIRHGRTRKYFDLARTVEEYCPEGGTVVCNLTDSSIFHFLTGRLFEQLPRTKSRGDRYVSELLDGFNARLHARFLLVDDSALTPETKAAILESLANCPDLELLANPTSRYMLYRRRAPGRPVTSAKTPTTGKHTAGDQPPC